MWTPSSLAFSRFPAAGRKELRADLGDRCTFISKTKCLIFQQNQQSPGHGAYRSNLSKWSKKALCPIEIKAVPVQLNTPGGVKEHQFAQQTAAVPKRESYLPPRTAQTNPSPNPKSVVFSRFNSHYASMTKRSNTDTCSTLRTATSFAGRLRFIRQDSTRVLVYILPVCDAVLGTYSRVWVLQVTLGTGEFVSEPGHSSEC